MAKRYKPELIVDRFFEQVDYDVCMVQDKHGMYIHIDSHLSTVGTLIKAQNKNKKYKEEIERLKEEIKRLSK